MKKYNIGDILYHIDSYNKKIDYFKVKEINENSKLEDNIVSVENLNNKRIYIRNDKAHSNRYFVSNGHYFYDLEDMILIDKNEKQQTIDSLVYNTWSLNNDNSRTLLYIDKKIENNKFIVKPLFLFDENEISVNGEENIIKLNDFYCSSKIQLILNYNNITEKMDNNFSNIKEGDLLFLHSKISLDNEQYYINNINKNINIVKNFKTFEQAVQFISEITKKNRELNNYFSFSIDTYFDFMEKIYVQKLKKEEDSMLILVKSNKLYSLYESGFKVYQATYDSFIDDNPHFESLKKEEDGIYFLDNFSTFSSEEDFDVDYDFEKATFECVNNLLELENKKENLVAYLNDETEIDFTSFEDSLLKKEEFNLAL